MGKREGGDRLWSFSRLESYNQCPYAWYKHYVLGEDGEDSFYSQNGTDVHEILDMINKGDIDLEDAAAEYLDRTEYNSNYVRENIRESTIEKCANFFTEYDFWWLDETAYEIVASEKELFWKINGHKFHGFIDLLLRSVKTGKLIIVDYKSSDYPLKKDGKSVLKSAESRFLSQKRQECLYAEAVKQNYGEYPVALSWLFFKVQRYLAIPLRDVDFQEAKTWALEMIAKIDADETFAENRTDFMMCSALCGFRNNCEYKEFEDE
jgi:hypothetical protein